MKNNNPTIIIMCGSSASNYQMEQKVSMRLKIKKSCWSQNWNLNRTLRFRARVVKA